MKLPSSVPITIRFPLALYQAVGELAEEQRRSFSWIVLRALEEQFLPEPEKPKRVSKDANS